MQFSGSKSYDSAFSHVDALQFTVDELGSSTSFPVFQTTLFNLFPGTVYEITVFAINGAGEGESSVVQVETLIGNQFSFMTDTLSVTLHLLIPSVERYTITFSSA